MARLSLQRQYLGKHRCTKDLTGILDWTLVFDFQRTFSGVARGLRNTRGWSLRASDMSEIPKLKDIRQVTDDPPPFLGRWPVVYAAVLCVLAAVIAGLYAFMRAFAA